MTRIAGLLALCGLAAQTSAAPPVSRVLDVKGVRIHYLDQGTGGAGDADPRSVFQRCHQLAVSGDYGRPGPKPALTTLNQSNRTHRSVTVI